MHLHEFLASNRDELLQRALQRRGDKDLSTVSPEQASDLSAMFDEVVSALQKHAGLAADSALPSSSASAALLGEHTQRTGRSTRETVKLIGAISAELGDMGARQGMSFDAGEYGLFNRCIDECVADAIERYWANAQSSTQLEAAERVGSIAHELRNALWTARMALSRLQEGEVGVRSRTGQVLERSLARMQQLVGQTLVASRLEAAVPPELRALSARALLLEIESAAVPERNITVTVDAPAELELLSDEGVLASALGNLLQNALKFTKTAGRIVLSARAHKESAC